MCGNPGAGRSKRRVWSRGKWAPRCPSHARRYGTRIEFYSAARCAHQTSPPLCTAQKPAARPRRHPHPPHPSSRSSFRACVGRRPRRSNTTPSYATHSWESSTPTMSGSHKNPTRPGSAAPSSSSATASTSAMSRKPGSPRHARRGLDSSALTSSSALSCKSAPSALGPLGALAGSSVASFSRKCRSRWRTTR